MYDVKENEIFLGSRKKNIIFAKRLYIFTLREMFGLTIQEIGDITNLHHSSILHHTRTFQFFYNNIQRENANFKIIADRVNDVGVDEQIEGLESKLKDLTEALTRLYIIKKVENVRKKRESLLTE
tara:strand:- start:19 stop:393 length:375 start_codon:yes stop_codon:yes gene_type:complete